jgi:hypothetical protein
MDGGDARVPLNFAHCPCDIERFPNAMKRLLLRFAWVSAALCIAGSAGADQTVQIPVDALLDGRPVSTLTDGAVVRWTTGVDQNDGFITTAAAAKLMQSGPALPDDGTFAADDTHPELVLHFSNTAAASSQQAHIVPAAGTFSFDVPHATYSKLFLAITSSSGDSALSVTLNYADGSPTVVNFTLPDWGTGKPLPTDPPIFFNLISGLHKWDAQDNSVDTPSHALTGVVLTPVATQMLSSVQVSKPNAAQYLVFWGATGVATGNVAGDGGASGAGGAATAGSGGLAGGGMSGGASSSGGASGGAGSPGGTAGASSSAGTSSGSNAGGSSAGSSNPTSSAGNSGGEPAMSTPSNSSDSGGCAIGKHRTHPRDGWIFLLALGMGTAGFARRRANSLSC